MPNLAGACFPENINKIEDQNKSSGSLGGSVSSHEISVPCNEPGESEISTLMNSGQGGDQAISCNVNTSLSGEKDDIVRNEEILDDDKDIKIYHRRKRLKKEDHSEFLRADGEELGAFTPLCHEEQQCTTSNADLSLGLLDGTQGVSSQVVHERMNLHIDRPLVGYKQKKLLVLDLNGLLIDISSVIPYNYEPDAIIMKKAVFRRPHCDDFLNFCFERFNVGFWTSRTKRNMEPILDFLLGNSKSRLLFYWDQSHCTDTRYYTVEKRDKPLLLKKLKKLWDKREPGLPWEKGVYNESNTLLVDDTPSKALSNPRYTAVFPYSYRYRDARDNSLGPGGDLRVYLEGLAEANNVQEYVKQNPFGQRPITEKNLSWGYYRKVIEANSTPPRETDTNNP